MDVLNRKHLPVSAVSGASVVFTFSAETSVDVSGLRICKASQLWTLHVSFFGEIARVWNILLGLARFLHIWSEKGVHIAGFFQDGIMVLLMEWWWWWLVCFHFLIELGLPIANLNRLGNWTPLW